jgi:hypothetical protein
MEKSAAQRLYLSLYLRERDYRVRAITYHD